MGDLPDFVTGVDTGILQAASLVNGADAAKATYPAVGDVYLATDTRKLYICVAAGGWTGFDASILIQGILTLYADLAGGGFEIKNIKDPTAAQSAATAAYVLGLLTGYLDLAHETETTGIHGVGASTIDSVALRDAAVAAEATARANADALRLLLAGGTMTGPIAMGTNKITGLGDPAAAQDAATQAYVLAQKALCLLLTGGTMSGAIAMGTNKITGLGAPTAAADAARKAEVDAEATTRGTADTNEAAARASADTAIENLLDDVSPSSFTPTSNTVYRNTSGKIQIIILRVRGTSTTAGCTADLFSDASASPTTRIGVAQHMGESSDSVNWWGCITWVVPPNYYYKIALTNITTPVCTVWTLF